MKMAVAREDTMVWVWMGQNPIGGKDWNLGSVQLFTVSEALTQYERRLRRAGCEGGARG
jgi:hypothetical protein